MSESGTLPCARAAAAPAVPLIERVLFYALLAVLCARPLISETFDRIEFSFLGPLVNTGGPTPVTTVWLDSLLLALSAAVFARRRGVWPGGAWVVVATAMLGGAVVLSVVAAGDKRAAANAGASLLVAVVAGVALVRVMSAPWMARLLIAALLAGACTNAIKCITQRTYEFGDTLEYWEEQKQTLVAGGFDVDEPHFVNYERRLRSGEAFGYLSHPNVVASCMTMGLLVAGGLLAGALSGFRQSAGAAGVAAALGATLAFGLWLTGSIGAVAAAISGAVALLALGLARRWIAGHPRRVMALLAAGYLAVVAGAAAYGMARGTLPHSSLAFRWHYWTAAVKTIPEAPLTGIGRDNFSAAFMRHKSPESPEEVRNPHNLWLSLLVELGPLGLIGGGVLIGACVLGALRRLDSREADTTANDRLTVGRLIPAAIGVLLVHAAFSGTPLHMPGMAIVWAIELGGAWTLTFVLSAWALRTDRGFALPATWFVAGLTAAMLAALVHGLVGFALLTPAGLSVFVTCAAAVFALKPSAEARTTRVWPMLGGLGGLGLLGAHVLLVVLPTTRMEPALYRLRDVAMSGQAATIVQSAERALAADRWDAAGARAVAQAGLRASYHPVLGNAERIDLLELADRCALTARARDAQVSAVHRLLATIAEARTDAHINHAEPDAALAALGEAVAHWDAAVAAYPTNPRLRISAGKAWARLWRQTEDANAGRAATVHLREALAINEHRKPIEVTRLRPEEHAVIDRYLGELREAGFGNGPASQPD